MNTASRWINSIIKACGVVFLLMMLIVLLGECSSRTKKSSQQATNQSTSNTPTKQTQSTAPRQPESKWRYSESQDKMRGTVSHFAMLISDTKADVGSIGRARVALNLRSGDKYGNDVFFTVDGGVFHCSIMDSCTINVQFDNGTIENLSVVEANASLGDTLFLADEKTTVSRFATQLKHSKLLRVEFEFVNHGREQFEFDTRQLNWSYF